MKSKRIILDTNLWISFLISKTFKEFDKIIKNQKVTLLFSNELLEEFIDVVKRPKFKKYFSHNNVKLLLSTFNQYGELIKVTSNVNICRDKKDNFLLNLSIDGRADFLATGDKDLLVLESIENTQILSFNELLMKLKN